MTDEIRLQMVLVGAVIIGFIFFLCFLQQWSEKRNTRNRVCDRLDRALEQVRVGSKSLKSN